jgi:hypothetical protein
LVADTAAAMAVMMVILKGDMVTKGIMTTFVAKRTIK